MVLHGVGRGESMPESLWLSLLLAGVLAIGVGRVCPVGTLLRLRGGRISLFVGDFMSTWLLEHGV